VLCTHCRRELSEDARFCSGCGSPVEPRGPQDGERRQLTVAFCDLVGSTEFAARLDPEEWRDLVRGYHAAAADVIARFGGHVAQYLGDGVLAWFGWPTAHDDDAERAVRAGLALLDAIAQLNERAVASQRPPLAVRVGIHTGAVVVGGAGAFGETPNVAARVQAAAAADSVWITEATHRLVSGLFVVDALGPHPLKGTATSIPLYRVRQPSGVRGRLGAAAARGLTPFVGREEERRLLQARWEQVEEGDGQVVLVTGEAGIGKSRLVQAFKEDLGGARHTWIECAGSSFHGNTPFHPVTEMLAQAFGLREGDAPERALDRLVAALASAGLAPAEAVPLIAPLLGLESTPDYPSQLLAPAQQRRRLVSTLTAWIFASARLQPVVLLVEDLQWVDPSTLELLGLLVEQGATVPLLLLLTARPDFHAPWPLRAHQAQLVLNRLSRRHVRAMVRQVIARVALSDEVVEAVAARTDGVPLFVEELTRLVHEGGGPRTSVAHEIPTTLQASLNARLDQIGRAKEVAQIGAVIGREFSHTLLLMVSELPEDELLRALEALTQAELLHARGQPPDATYLFKHALVQDAAYASLLNSRRRELHRRIARVLGERFPERAGREPELLAHHWTEAGEASSAIDAWWRAGLFAMTRFAHAEAVAHFERGLGLLATLADSPERAQRELQLLVLLGQSLFVVKGFGASEPAAVVGRVRELTERLEDSPAVFLTLLGIAASANARAEYRSGREVAERLLAMANHVDLPSARVWGHFLEAEACYHSGEPVRAHDHFERAIELYGREEKHLDLVLDPGVLSYAYAGLAAWQVGLADTARERLRVALELAQGLGRHFDLGLAEALGGILAFELREPARAEALDRLDALLRMAREHQFQQLRVHATAQRGWALVQAGQHVEGVAELRAALAMAFEAGQRPSQVHYQLVLAEALATVGEVDEAMALVDGVLTESGEVALERPDALRLRADLLSQRGAPSSEVESSYREAIGLAKAQGSRAYELRATAHFGRWLAARGRGAEAASLLAPLLASFSEGADTHDLREARALLGAFPPEASS
jgi:class 3 adenylate cyclase/tetratricopeptide (TPR) repeat protein